MQTPIFDFVRRYAASGTTRLHMPGHKGTGPLGCEALDITEISGADSLYEAQGIIAASERNAAALFGARQTYYCAEGSSQCIKAMLQLALQATGRRRILAARNVHKSFVHAAALLDFEVSWLWPEPYQLLRCPVEATRLEQILAQQTELPAAVYVTSPDYLGHMQPVGQLAEVCHRYGVLLLVDNAHGAYLHFLPRAVHPMDLGADACCDSAHKTLPVLTGGAYLHLGRELASETCVRQTLSLFGSTSPSYLILQSLDLCNAYLAGAFRQELARTVERVARLKAQLAQRQWLVEPSEPLKLVLGALGGNGDIVAQRLRQGGVECEYADPDHLVLMFTPCNPDADDARVLAALGEGPGQMKAEMPCTMAPPERAMDIRTAMFSPVEEIPVAQAAGRICAAPTVACPPAVPVVVSGEVIGPDAAAVFAHYGVQTVLVVK